MFLSSLRSPRSVSFWRCGTISRRMRRSLKKVMDSSGGSRNLISSIVLRDLFLSIWCQFMRSGVSYKILLQTSQPHPHLIKSSIITIICQSYKIRLRNCDVIFYVVVHLRHLDLVVHDVGCEVPECCSVLSSLCQLVELPQAQLSEVVPVQLQTYQILVGFQTFRQHPQPIVIDVISSQIQVHDGSILGQSLRDCFGSIVADAVGGHDEGLQYTILGGKNLREGLTTVESNLVATEIQHPQLVVFQDQVLDGKYSIASQAILSQGQLLQTPVNLQHLGEVDCALLPNTLIVRVVQVEHFQRIVIPVEDTGYADDSIDVDAIVGHIQLLEGPLLVFLAGEQQSLGDALSEKRGTIIPLVPIWLFSRLRYLRVSKFCRQFPSFSALASPRLFPCRFRLVRDGQDSKHFENIYNPMSVSSLKEKSICRTICFTS